MLPSSVSIDCSCSLLSSSSISSSSSSNNSSFSLNNTNNKTNNTNNNPKTMEEVWNDITIDSLPNTPIISYNIHHSTPTSNHFRGIILQDFLNNNDNGVDERRFNNNKSNKNPTTINNRTSILEFLSPPINPQSNNTNTHEFQFFDHNPNPNHNHNPNPNHNHNQFSKQGNSSISGLLGFSNGGYDALASTSLLTTFGGDGCHGGARGSEGGVGGGALTNIRKRINESGGGGDDEDESVDRRHKRMIKNRESAARSRARKQAYITELELEVANLSKENAMLRKKNRQFIESPPSQQLPKKYGLYRTSTAPF